MRELINTSTVMYGVFGDPIQHSKSPVMLNRAFHEVGLNAAYAAFHITPEKLKDAVYGIKALGFRGVNVTIPHKVEVMKYVDVVDQSALDIGAVNTIVNDAGILTGYNTDGIGYVRSLKEETGFSCRGKNILVIGAGGAARGIVYALAKEQPAAIWIANRSVDKARDLAAVIRPYCESQGKGYEEITQWKQEADLIVNTTFIGNYPHVDEIPLDPSALRQEAVVSDIVYNPLQTRWLRMAEERGLLTHSGLGMFIYQGAYAFEYWTGLQAPTIAMRAVVEQSFREGGA